MTTTNTTRRTAERIDELKAAIPTGTRVKLLRCADIHTHIEPGTEGLVAMVDDIGTVHVHWFDGSRLGLVDGEDEWLVVNVHGVPTSRWAP